MLSPPSPHGNSSGLPMALFFCIPVNFCLKKEEKKMKKEKKKEFSDLINFCWKMENCCTKSNLREIE